MIPRVRLPSTDRLAWRAAPVPPRRAHSTPEPDSIPPDLPPVPTPTEIPPIVDPPDNLPPAPVRDPPAKPPSVH